jgi:hypothetical protein
MCLSHGMTVKSFNRPVGLRVRATSSRSGSARASMRERRSEYQTRRSLRGRSGSTSSLPPIPGIITIKCFNASALSGNLLDLDDVLSGSYALPM